MKYKILIVLAKFYNDLSIRNDFSRFYADPNLFGFQGRNFLLVEDCNLFSEKACITQFEISPKTTNLKHKKVVVNESFHISFPFVR